mmetsp:Transcript_135571/g.306748  ORF Transcript_135571/g.306748 Transcript_135571/m.306748 type:complete len:299 (+) Transcript_135571:57-953(+)
MASLVQTKNTFLEVASDNSKYRDEILRTWRGSSRTQSVPEAGSAATYDYVNPLDSVVEQPTSGWHAGCEKDLWGAAEYDATQNGSAMGMFTDGKPAHGTSSPEAAALLSQFTALLEAAKNAGTPVFHPAVEEMIRNLASQGGGMQAQAGVPPGLEVGAGAEEFPLPEGCTTVMLKNLPNRLTTTDVQAFLEKQGLRNTFDLVRVPKDSRTRANLGYAFINFKSPLLARQGAARLTGVPLKESTSSKVTEVSAAALQGKDSYQPRLPRTARRARARVAKANKEAAAAAAAADGAIDSFA